MTFDDFFDDHLRVHPVMGIFRNYPPATTVELCEAAWKLGVELIEVPVQEPTALPSLAAAIAAAQRQGRVVGAGTVTSTDQLEAVHRLGAAFTVAPGFEPEVITRSRALGLPHLPGVATSTEIGRALTLDCLWLKAFPAKQLGPDWITAQLAPFPSARFVATGGVDATNMAEFLQAGCRAVAIGSALRDPATFEALKAVTTSAR